MLTAAELARYSRQLVLPELGLAGQERLRESRVLVVGAGGLGSPAALYLAAAGVGVIGIVDDDAVELSNLHRQILHRASGVGTDKTASAAATLRALNGDIEIREHRLHLTRASAATLVPDYDLVVDGSDNYPTRYAVNDACAALGKPWVYGSVERFSGQVALLGAPDGPCYRCIFPEPPAPGSTPSCEEIGVLGAVPGVIGAMQAVEALKWLVGIGTAFVGRLLQFDMLRGELTVVHIPPRPDCPACQPASDTADTIEPDDMVMTEDVQPEELASLSSAGAVEIIDVREPWEWSLGRIPGARHVPLGQLEEAMPSFDRARDMVVYCHHGARSDAAAAWLRSQGYRARNLAGGIDRWSREVDPAVPRY